jgi:mono/diheme cytochrome c family protein
MKTSFVVLTVFILALALVLAAGAQTPPPARTVWDGIYTTEQAARGEQSYKESCARCHGGKLEGTQGNGLQGNDFMERWREDSMGSLFEFVSENMPPLRRGVGRPLIGIPTYIDIIAFVLSKNDFPAGPNPLTPEGLDAIRIQHKEGPRPLPNGALVRISGCLTGSGQTWSVTSATDAVRTRTSQTNDYAEFQEAEAAPAGTQSYRLANTGFLNTTFKLDQNVGAKLLVKGTLARQQDSSVRISALAVRKVADTCP